MPEQDFLILTSPTYSEFMRSLTVNFFFIVTYLILASRIYDLAAKNWSSAANGVHVKANHVFTLICLKDNTTS